MKTHTVGIIMNGVTGRMGTNQHLVRSILAIREQGGVRINDGETILPEPVLTGRSEAKLATLSAAHGGLPYSTDVDSLLKDEKYSLYFDAQTTPRRYADVKKAIAAGKHIYCEKPTATTSADGLDLYRLASEVGIKHGVVQDKLWLPGFRKLSYLIDTGFFGEILSVRGEFGYWVFTGETQPAQRPSWNYRKADGGGIILDMFCHWRYVIDNLFGNITAVSALGATHIKRRWDERGQPYECDTDDAAYATFMTDRNIICHFNSSWCTRVRRDDLRHRFTSTGPKVPRSRGYANVGSNPTRQRRSPYGIPISRVLSTTVPVGSACRQIRTTTTRSKFSGSCSCATWFWTNRFAGT